MFQITFYDQKRSMILSSQGEAVSGSASGSTRWSLASPCLGSPIVWLRSTRHLPSGSLWNMNKIDQMSTKKSLILRLLSMQLTLHEGIKWGARTIDILHKIQSTLVSS